MSKLRKLWATPGPFFRDFLFKRYPLDFGSNVGVVGSAGSAGSDKPVRELLDVLPVSFPIDFVYTWVDHTDAEWQAAKALHAQRHGTASQIDEDTAALARYEDHDELRYSLRALQAYAPWVRHVYLVTAGHLPRWLRRDHPKLRVVRHADILPAESLPTFNSHVIEAHLHAIDGLAEHYVYFNDDVMLARPMEPSDFFLGSGAALVSTSGKQIPGGEPSAQDTSMDCASKLVRGVIARAYGVEIDRQILHSYHTQRKTTAQRCEALIREHGQAFADHRFRSLGDLNVATLMHHYVGYLHGLSVFARSRCMYLNVRSPRSAFGYKAMLDWKGSPQAPEAVCVNQVDLAVDAAERERYDRALAEFLQSYYSVASGFER